MSCLLYKSIDRLWICQACGYEQTISFPIILDMPMNNALIKYIKEKNKKNWKKQEILWDGKKTSDFEINQSELGKINPYMDEKDELKCIRSGCTKEKFCYDNVIYQYCSVECYNLDNPYEVNAKLFS